MKKPEALPVLQIRRPCPKRWEELVGDERERFCSECSLHVLNAAELTRGEAQDLVRQASTRVCMRIEYDDCGAPRFREPAVQRLARWALAAGAALLAACQGSVATTPGDQKPVQPTSKTGQVVSPAAMGDVARAPDPHPERLGEAAPASDPAVPRAK